MALITGNSEKTQIIWTTRELRVWTQCCQMISWLSCGRKEGLFQWANKSTVELWGTGDKSAGYTGHDILQAHPRELGLKPSSRALSSVVGEGVQWWRGSVQMGANIEDLLGVRAKPKWRWGQREREQKEDGEAERVFLGKLLNCQGKSQLKVIRTLTLRNEDGMQENGQRQKWLEFWW